MRLLLVHDRGALGGGADRATFEAARAMAARHHHVTVALGEGPGGIHPAWQAELGPGAVVALGSQVDAPGATRRVRRRLAVALDPAPDWVVVSEALNPLLPGPLPPGTRLAKWLHAHGETCPLNERRRPDGAACEAAPGWVCLQAGCLRPGPWGGLWPILRRRWLLAGIAAADRCLVASRYMGRLAEGLGVPPARVRLLRYPLLGPPAAPPPPSCRPRALALGRLVEAKGILAFAEAFVGAGGELEVVGEGPERARLEALRAGSSGRLQLSGWCHGEALEAAYARASLVVVPSRWPEPYGMVGPEALLRGRPVLAAAVGGMGDWAGPGVVAVPPDPAGMAATARELLGDGPRLAALAAAARERRFPDQTPEAFGAAMEAALGPP